MATRTAPTANSVPGGTIREGALFFQTVAAGGGGGTIQEGALFKRGHYSRGGTIQEGALFKRGHYSRGGTIRASTVNPI